MWIKSPLVLPLQFMILRWWSERGENSNRQAEVCLFMFLYNIIITVIENTYIVFLMCRHKVLCYMVTPLFFTSLNRELAKLSKVTLLGSNRRMICTLRSGSRLLLLTMVARSTGAESAQWLGEPENKLLSRTRLHTKRSKFLLNNEIKFELLKWIPPFYDTELQLFLFCFTHRKTYESCCSNCFLFRRVSTYIIASDHCNNPVRHSSHFRDKKTCLEKFRNWLSQKFKFFCAWNSPNSNHIAL